MDIRLKRKSSILISSVWIIAILSLFALGVGFRASLDIRLAKYNMDKLRAHNLAYATVIKALSLLDNDDNDYDSLFECGLVLPFDGKKTPQDIFGPENNIFDGVKASIFYGLVYNGREKKHFSMIDEERKININMPIDTQMQRDEYKRVLMGLSENISEHIVNAIIDFRDKDDELSFPGGAEENDYYGLLDYPYQCKNENFQNIEELLLVKGLTKEIFNEIKDYITIYSLGAINVNTASKKVLNAVINNQASDFTRLVNSIIYARAGRDGKPATEDDLIMKSIQDLMAIDGVSELNEYKKRINDLRKMFIFDSNYFRIISHAKAENVSKTLSCIVRKNETDKFLFYHQQ